MVFLVLKIKNIYYREEGPWHGFNPKSKTFMDGMFSRNTDPNNRSNVVINPAKENVNYKVNKQKYGGIIKTQGGSEGEEQLIEQPQFQNGGWLDKSLNFLEPNDPKITFRICFS